MKKLILTLLCVMICAATSFSMWRIPANSVEITNAAGTTNNLYPYLTNIATKVDSNVVLAAGVPTNTATIAACYLLTSNAYLNATSALAIANTASATGVYASALAISNNGWSTLLQAANDTLNQNFTNLSVAYSNTAAVVNTNAAVINTNAYVHNGNQATLSNRVYTMGEYIRGAFLSLTNAGVSVGAISNAMGWSYPYVEQTNGAINITNTLSLGSIDLVGPITTLASNIVDTKTPGIVTTTITQTVIQAVSSSPWTELTVPTGGGSNEYFEYVTVTDTNDNPWVLDYVMDCYSIKNLATGLYQAQGHWGTWNTNRVAPYVLFGGYPPTAEDPPRKYQYIIAPDGRDNGEYALMFQVDSTNTSLGIYTPLTNRANSVQVPLQIRYFKIGAGQ